MEAIKQTYTALDHIKEPTLEMYRLAYQQAQCKMLKYVNFDKFNIEDIIGKVETKYIEVKVNTIDKIVYKDISSEKHKYIDKLDNVINSITNHVKTEFSYNGSVTLMSNNNVNQDINKLLILPTETQVEDSYHVLQNQKNDSYELYKKYSELVETGYFVSTKVPKPKVVKVGEYFEPQL